MEWRTPGKMARCRLRCCRWRLLQLQQQRPGCRRPALLLLLLLGALVGWVAGWRTGGCLGHLLLHLRLLECLGSEAKMLL